MTTIAKKPSALHPGTPPSMEVGLKVRVVHQTEKAYLVQWAEFGSVASAWVPKRSVTMTATNEQSIEHRDGRTFRIHMMRLPAWLYMKIQPQL